MLRQQIENLVYYVKSVLISNVLIQNEMKMLHLGLKIYLQLEKKHNPINKKWKF